MRGSPPFDSDLALGMLDSAFLFAYSFGMFATGVLADRAGDLAVFLGGAHVLAGLALVALGAGRRGGATPPFAFFVACSARGAQARVARVRRGDGAPRRPRAAGQSSARGTRERAKSTVVGKTVSRRRARRLGAADHVRAPGVRASRSALIARRCAAPARRRRRRRRRARPSTVRFVASATPTRTAARRSARRRGRRPRAILAVPGLVPFSLCLFLNKLVAYALMLWLPLFLDARPRRSERGHDLASSTSAACSAGWRAGRLRPLARATVSAAASRSARRAPRARARSRGAARNETALLVAVGALVGRAVHHRRPSPRTSGNTEPRRALQHRHGHRRRRRLVRHRRAE